MENELTYEEHVNAKMTKRDRTVILINGFKRSGKDFTSTVLNNELPKSMVYSLAAPLKDIVATTMSVSLNELDNFKNNKEELFIQDTQGDVEYITDFRSILQIFGTEAMKKYFGQSVWVDVFNNLDFQDDYIIISDWRFNIEYEEIVKVYKNVVTVRINDDNIVNTDTHASETELLPFKFDHILDNTAKDESILSQISDLIEEIKDVKNR